jgi:hypothetical protein
MVFLGRTLRNQSGSCGSRTIGSMLTGGGSGAGGVRRMYAWYKKNNTSVQFYDNILDIKYGKFKKNPEWLLSNVF